MTSHYTLRCRSIPVISLMHQSVHWHTIWKIHLKGFCYIWTGGLCVYAYVCVCLCVCGCVCDHTYSLLFLSPCLYRLVWHSAGVCVCLSRGPQSAGWCSDSHGFLESSVPRPLKMTSGCAPSQFARLFSKKHTYTHTKTHTHTWW